jgi:hypothetical protein
MVVGGEGGGMAGALEEQGVKRQLNLLFGLKWKMFVRSKMIKVYKPGLNFFLKKDFYILIFINFKE